MERPPPSPRRLRLPQAAGFLDRRALDRARRRAARLAQPPSIADPPEPQAFTDPGRARQIMAGRIRLGGDVIDLAGRSLWDALPGPAALAAAQDFAWLDDLAALGGARARRLAQDWTDDWIDRFTGLRTRPRWHPWRSAPHCPPAVWGPAATAPRLLRLIDHAGFLTEGRDSTRLATTIALHAWFLDRRARAAAPGPARITAWAALVRAGLLLPGLGLLLPLEALAAECRQTVDATGAIGSRVPEDLLDLFSLLIATAAALTEADRTPPGPMLDAIARIAPLLRALRHADGGLPRLHGGDRGPAGRLDTALAASGIRTRATGGLQMGYARISAGRTSVMLDAAPPPPGGRAQAATLSIELTCGRRPLIVSCGPGATFGPEWAHASRATSAHSTLCLADRSSAVVPAGADALVDPPLRVICDSPGPARSLQVEAAHDGWTRSHGLTHARRLALASDGRSLSGEDMLVTLTPADRTTFDRATAGLGADFTLRFHLHPDVVALPDGNTIALALRSGEFWVFRHDGTARLSLEPSVYFDTARLVPRRSQQVVLSGRAMSYAVTVRWTFATARATPRGLRDLAADDSAVDPEDSPP